MTTCEKCNSSETVPLKVDAGESNLVIIGNMNVGKSTLFSRMTGTQSTSVNIPGTTVSVKKGQIKGKDGMLYDTPGIHSIFSLNEDERASRDILLTPGLLENNPGIILVVDAKNLKRSLAIALQYAEYKLPMLLVVNMIDEASSRGIEIDYQKLSEKLGLQVCTTIAREGIGVGELLTELAHVHAPSINLSYTERIEEFLEMVEKLLNPKNLSSRALGLLLLSGDPACESYVREKFGEGMLSQLQQLADDYRQEETVSIDISLSNFYHREAAKIADSVQKIEAPTRNPFVLTFGDWCTQLSTGIPIALVVVTAMYYFVGSFGATFLVDTINGVVFENWLIPVVTNLIEPVPLPFIRDMIIDPDFGVLPTGVFLALGLVLPVIFCFYIAFGILEDSGYLPRIAILLDRIFQKMGLNGKGVIPLVMGFSCVTMSVLTTRVLDTEKEKNIASFLVFLCLPCAPLIAVMFVILEKMPISATFTILGFIFSQLLIAGYIANKVLPGRKSSLTLEIPTMRIPKIGAVIKMSTIKTYFFMKEALPVFIFASIAVFIFQRIGGLGLLENALGPVIDKVMGLPEKSIQVFIKTIIRREAGAVELDHLSQVYTNLQLVVNLLLMIFLAPCINAIIVLFKERGKRTASAIMSVVIVYAIAIASLVNHTCLLLNITFT
ncbi:MAG: ferrous iron transporter B [SAR324 cluster bacterium]|nr:ferrous iron transporter B [SAR324 cluster bacterium]